MSDCPYYGIGQYAEPVYYIGNKLYYTNVIPTQRVEPGQFYTGEYTQGIYSLNLETLEVKPVYTYLIERDSNNNAEYHSYGLICFNDKLYYREGIPKINEDGTVGMMYKQTVVNTADDSLEAYYIDGEGMITLLYADDEALYYDDDTYTCYKMSLTEKK